MSTFCHFITGPDILEHLQDIQANRGTDIKLRVQYAYSKYPVNIQWKKGSKILDSVVNRARGGCITLNIYGITFKHRGEYTVIIRDPYNRKQAESSCDVEVF